MVKNYTLERVTLDAGWDSLVSQTKEGTIFSKSVYLSNLNEPLGLYKCKNSSETRALVVLIESADGINCVLNDFVIYGGILYGPPTNGQNKAQQISERFDIATFISAELLSKYEKVAFNFSPDVIDIRPFLWHNYGTKGVHYLTNVLYTSHLDLKAFLPDKDNSSIDPMKRASVARRQQIRYGKKEGVKTELTDDISSFIDFYILTMERQFEIVSRKKVDQMYSLVDALVRTNNAKIYASRTGDGQLGSFAVYGFDEKRAYYLFGASDPFLRGTPVGTSVLWDSFLDLAKAGFNEIDLEGVNSPNRGWFKLSFGGDLKPYYQIYV